jgi:hypothetical protein
MKAVIRGSVPTTYQLSSISAFGLNYKKQSNGRISVVEYFDTISEARKKLRQIAENLFANGSFENKKEMLENYTKDSLCYDAACIVVESVKDFETIH